MMWPLKMPAMHYTIEFGGDERQRSWAENWCHAMLPGGCFVEGVDDEIVYHFDNVVDATNFRVHFGGLCGELRSSSEPFLPML